MAKHINNVTQYRSNAWVTVLSLRRVAAQCWIERARKGSATCSLTRQTWTRGRRLKTLLLLNPLHPAPHERVRLCAWQQERYSRLFCDTDLPPLSQTKEQNRGPRGFFRSTLQQPLTRTNGAVINAQIGSCVLYLLFHLPSCGAQINTLALPARQSLQALWLCFLHSIQGLFQIWNDSLYPAVSWMHW